MYEQELKNKDFNSMDNQQQLIEMATKIERIATNQDFLKETMLEIKQKLDKHEEGKAQYATKKDFEKHCEDNAEHIEIAKKGPDLIKQVEEHENRIKALEDAPKDNVFTTVKKIGVFIGFVIGTVIVNFVLKKLGLL